MTKLEFGKHVTLRSFHWALKNNDEIFGLVRGQRYYDRFLEGSADWVFDGPALKLFLRIRCSSIELRRFLEGQIFLVVRSQKLIRCLRELSTRVIDGEREVLLYSCLVFETNFVAEILTRDELAKRYNLLVNRNHFSDIQLFFLTSFS